MVAIQRALDRWVHHSLRLVFPLVGGQILATPEPDRLTPQESDAYVIG